MSFRVEILEFPKEKFEFQSYSGLELLSVPLPDGVVVGMMANGLLQISVENLHSWHSCLQGVNPVSVSLSGFDVDVDVDGVDPVARVAAPPPTTHVTLHGRVYVFEHA